MHGMTTIWSTPCMMVTMIISTRTPNMVASLGRVVGEVVQAMRAVDSMWVDGMWAHSWLLYCRGTGRGLIISGIRWEIWVLSLLELLYPVLWYWAVLPAVLFFGPFHPSVFLGRLSVFVAGIQTYGEGGTLHPGSEEHAARLWFRVYHLFQQPLHLEQHCLDIQDIHSDIVTSRYVSSRTGGEGSQDRWKCGGWGKTRHLVIFRFGCFLGTFLILKQFYLFLNITLIIFLSHIFTTSHWVEHYQLSLQPISYCSPVQCLSDTSLHSTGHSQLHSANFLSSLQICVYHNKRKDNKSATMVDNVSKAMYRYRRVVSTNTLPE